ncbi:Glutathione S-transferase, N-terminal domain, partial [Rhizoctonia solani]
MSSSKPGNFITRLFHHKKKSEEKVTTASTETTKPATSTTKQPVLYVFSASVWASAPSLALLELKYPPGAVEEKAINLLEGENFTPEFIKINNNATLPTLATTDKIYTDTTGSVEWIVLNAPTPGAKSSHQDVIVAVHRDNIDPNFSLLSARNQEELDAKRGDVPGQFIRQRQAKLEELAPKSPENLQKWYKDKLEFNGLLSSVYAEGAPTDITSGWFDKSNQHWDNVKTFIASELPAFLPESGFVDGSAPGEADFHVAAWLARTAGVSGAKIDDISPLGEALGLTLDPKVVAYFDAWKLRDSWKKVYAEGLH